METVPQTLSFLVERAQYISGATGAAIALVEHPDLVCRARSGPTAPPLGVPLQTKTGITGQCLRTGQILHCRSVETDERVDVEGCRQLGIESILVLPLRRFDRVIGVFELFSAQPHAFEQSDVDALQRIGKMAEKALEGSLCWYEKQNNLRKHPLSPVKKKRRFQRYDLGVPLTIRALVSGVPQNIPGRSKNLGEGGLAAILAAELPPQTVVMVEFSLPLVRRNLSLRAAVRSQDRLYHCLEFLTPRLEEKNNFSA